MKRTMQNLITQKGRVYVYLSNEEIGLRFLRDAEQAGVRFADGVRPTERLQRVDYERYLRGESWLI